MASAQHMTKDEIVAQLKKDGVHDIDSLAAFVLKKAHQDGDANKPIANSVIIYHHGFVTS
jgi:hypothetical protein